MAEGLHLYISAWPHEAVEKEEVRPTLAEIWDMLREIELMSNIVWVRVALHDYTQIEEGGVTEVLILAGDSIVTGTTMQPSELEKQLIVNGYVLTA